MSDEKRSSIAPALETVERVGLTVYLRTANGKRRGAVAIPNTHQAV